MPRQARVVTPNVAHHVTQRGNYQMKVFDKEENHREYVRLINKYQEEYNREDSFIGKMEKKLKRKLLYQELGRPKGK